MITDTMYIGSGDITALLSDIHSSSYAKLLQRFVSGEKPHYNALASPIDALRTGAILEDVYGKTLPFCYVSQYKVQSIEMDVFKASLDFAEIDDGKLKTFIELKTVSFDEYFDKIVPLESNSEKLAYVRKYKKHYYNQVQEQLYCSGLDQATLAFLCVFEYNDEKNWNREIKDNEITRVTIPRDDTVIDQIKSRGEIFQRIKDYHIK